MKVTIAEPIQTLEYLRDSGVFPFNSKEGVLYTVESINIAIDTMRKYQKIEQAIRDYEKLCDSMSEQGLDGVACTKKVDEFCIDTMRGLLGEYYVERLKEDENDD